jgi:hypothetical protein
MPDLTPHPAEPAVPMPQAWDPFQLMDRLDEDALRRELDGVGATDLVYVVKQGGQEVVGLSKTGVDECCMALVSQGQVIREEDLQYEVLGEGEDREALFKVKAARFAVSPEGHEVRLDQVIGVKRQPLFYEPAQLDLDARVPSRKHKGRTYRELLQTDEGRDYLGWMAENFSEPAIRDFVQRILSGEEITGRRDRQLNPHWYEAGAMKAARNARFRLIPGTVRAQVIASARASGLARVVESKTGAPGGGPRGRVEDRRPWRRVQGRAGGAGRGHGDPASGGRGGRPGGAVRSHREAGRVLPAPRGVPRVLRGGATAGARVARYQGHPANHQGPDRLAQAAGRDPPVGPRPVRRLAHPAARPYPHGDSLRRIPVFVTRTEPFPSRSSAAVSRPPSNSATARDLRTVGDFANPGEKPHQIALCNRLTGNMLFGV